MASANIEILKELARLGQVNEDCWFIRQNINPNFDTTTEETINNIGGELTFVAWLGLDNQGSINSSNQPYKLICSGCRIRPQGELSPEFDPPCTNCRSNRTSTRKK